MTRVGWVIGAGILWFGSAIAQQKDVPSYCDAQLLSPQLGATGYKYKPEQRICEGTWQRRVSGSRALRIVSIYSSYRANKQPSLVWPGSIIRPTRVQVQSLRDDIPYQMDSLLDSSSSSRFEWSGVVLDSLKLSGAWLGVLSYEQDGHGEKIYLPVEAQLPPPILDDSIAKDDQWLHITLLPSRDLRQVRLVIRSTDSAKKVIGEEVAKNDLIAGLPQTLRVKAPRVPGEYVIGVQGKLADDAPVSLLARLRK